MTANAKPIRLLLVEDSADDAELLAFELTRSGLDIEITRIDTLAQLSDALQAGGWDVIVSDFNLPGFTAVEVLAKVRKTDADIPFIVVSGAVGEETAVKLMKGGAHDFFLKDRLTRLAAAIEREMREAQVRLEHRWAVLQLKESEERFRVLADAAPVMIWGTSEGMHRDYFNKPWLDFRGRTPVQEVGEGWMEGIHPDDLETVRGIYKRAVETRQEFSVEFRLRRRDGDYRWVMERGIPRHAPDATFAGFLGSCVDITEHKQTEQELKRAVQTRDDFFSAASHELRTPLTALTLQLETLRRKVAQGHIDEVAKGDRLNNAQRQTWRLSRLVESMLDVARITAGKLTLTPKKINLEKVVQDVVSGMRESIESSGSKIRLQLQTPVVGLWDPIQMETIVSNLLTNALKYGGAQPIEVHLEQDGGLAKLSVVDHGIGIAPEAQERIFERFERGVPELPYSGLGIGLWIVRQMIAAHGGVIRVVSQLGAGSTFVVELPVSAEAPQKEPTPRNASR